MCLLLASSDDGCSATGVAMNQNFGENEMNLTLESPLETLSRECERVIIRDNLYIMTEASRNQQCRSSSKYYVKHLKRYLRKDLCPSRNRLTAGLGNVVADEEFEDMADD